jgi:hypothetical protein
MRRSNTQEEIHYRPAGSLLLLLLLLLPPPLLLQLLSSLQVHSPLLLLQPRACGVSPSSVGYWCPSCSFSCSCFKVLHGSREWVEERQ